MEDICRLCCSPSFVNNNIFDEENALYLKMSLYLPIKVFKNDRLPQRVCDKCSCKVNDLYQFCNETIEVQERLRSVLVSNGHESEETVDLTRIKENVSPIPITKLEQCTQTDWNTDSPVFRATPCPSNIPQACVSGTLPNKIQIKEEPRTLSPVKEESDAERNDFSTLFSDDSDDMSLLSIKKKKKTKKEVNGVKKRGPRKKKLKEWDGILNGLPESTVIQRVNNVVERVNHVSERANHVGERVNGDEVKCTVKEELDQKLPVDVKVVKMEPSEMEVFHCCICFYQCFSRGDILQHYKQHASESPQPTEAPPAPPPPDTAPLRCTRCRKNLQPGEWAAHWTRHWQRDRRPYRCALCEKSFRDAHQILKHGQTHKYGADAEEEAAPANKRFICDLCPEGFVYMRYLLAHRAGAHPDAATRALVLRCSVCARQFAHLNSLRRHLRAHSGERNHLCNVCGKALSSREHLKFHIRIHTGYKPNVCKTCGKGFVKKCNLTLHERVHSGEKPHVCSSCGKAFSQRSTLVIHERYHSGARPYACALCGRGFVAKGLLSMHLKTTCI